jgi:hypothetical protein
LYVSANSFRIWKKMWSSTHLEMGPIPFARMIRVPGLAMDSKPPPLDARPKPLRVSMANESFSLRRTTIPGHCDGLTGMVRYASLMSRTAAWECGGSLDMRRHMMEKVLHVHGKRSESMEWLINDMGGCGWCGCEKFWISRNLPGFPGLGTRLRGEVWKGPRISSTCVFVKGPR